MSLINKGVPLSTAAAKAGMSEPTARKYRRTGKVPSEPRPARTWRTREDPYADVWEEAEKMLQIDSGLQAKTVFEELERRHPGRFRPGQLRTLQRRFRRWRAQHGPEKEVYFEQRHCPGERCQSDFTDMNSLYVTIDSEPFPHLLYHFVRKVPANNRSTYLASTSGSKFIGSKARRSSSFLASGYFSNNVCK